MTREEAVALLERYSNYDGMGIPNLAGCKEAMRVAVDALKETCPELRESEDERIRKVLVDMVKRETGFTGFPSQGQVLAYLEKQKDASKAIEAVDRIDKYIDEHLANAQEMRDSNPDKKYYCGWDDALDEMAVILQDVYSEEKQKEQNGEDEECTDFTIYHPLKNGKGKYECIPYSFYGSLTSFSEDKDLIDFLRTCFYTEEECNEWIGQQKEPHYTKRNALFDKCVENCDPEVMKSISDEVDEMLEKEQKPAEWSEFNLQPKQEWVEEDERDNFDILLSMIDASDSIPYIGGHLKLSDEMKSKLKTFIKSLRPSWKPSEEQMEALNALNLHGDLSYVGQQNQLISLYQDLKKLM